MLQPFDLLLRRVRLATMKSDGASASRATGIDPRYGAIVDAALGITGQSIAWIGRERDLPRDMRARRELDCADRWATPGLIDCHTHLVYAGNRARDFERRLAGESYAAIAASGGGIATTVAATRAASAERLAAESAPRLAALAASGATTVEIKSGYGLDTANEVKELEVARSIASAAGVELVTTLLAAHALPPEYAGRADDYVDYVSREMIPAVARRGLADAVDAYCETIGFTPAQTRRVFAAAKAQGLPVKLHADQLSDGGGAALAAEAGALSADHLEYTSEAGVAALARAGTVAVLLPGAWYTLRESRRPPIAALRDHAVPMAVATDCNPGTSPATSLPLMMNMACTLFDLAPAEALAGVTRCAARALGLADRGVLAEGLRADIALWDIDEPAELAWTIGATSCHAVVRGGRLDRERLT
ncbi:MAG TPA: imidazolonepropionase [Casimicrobiaceae bacterium]